MRIAVCVITYRRPKGLERLLEGVEGLTFRQDFPEPDVKVVVVDNDPAGSARALCETKGSKFKWAIKYEVEPNRGIPYARNRAITCAKKAGADFLAFVDDDEVPRPSWIGELLRVQSSYDADVVYGAVLPRFEEDAPAWVVKGGFFEHAFVKAGYHTGHLLELADTNNVLVRSKVFEEMGKNFDERFALTGGSDTHFFMRVSRAGYTIVWAADATVDDWIPNSRANAGWILQRAYRLGNTRSLCELDLEPSMVGRIVPVVKGCGRIIQGLLFVSPSLAFGKHELVKALYNICYGVGRLAGVIGVRYKEYRRFFGE